MEINILVSAFEKIYPPHPEEVEQFRSLLQSKTPLEIEISDFISLPHITIFGFEKQ